MIKSMFSDIHSSQFMRISSFLWLWLIAMVHVSANNDLVPVGGAVVEQCLNGAKSTLTMQSQNTYKLMAGQHIEVGSVTVEFHDELGTDASDFARVTYELNNDWYFEEVHLWIGNDPSGYPQSTKGKSAGNPRIGHFPYTKKDIPATSRTVEMDIPLPFFNQEHLTYICDACDPVLTNSFQFPVYILAHASVYKATENQDGLLVRLQQETAWSAGSNIGATTAKDTGSWATQSSCLFDLTCTTEAPTNAPTQPPTRAPSFVFLSFFLLFFVLSAFYFCVFNFICFPFGSFNFFCCENIFDKFVCFCVTYKKINTY